MTTKQLKSVFYGSRDCLTGYPRTCGARYNEREGE